MIFSLPASKISLFSLHFHTFQSAPVLHFEQSFSYLIVLTTIAETFFQNDSEQLVNRIDVKHVEYNRAVFLCLLPQLVALDSAESARLAEEIFHVDLLFEVVVIHFQNLVFGRCVDTVIDILAQRPDERSEVSVAQGL